MVYRLKYLLLTAALFLAFTPKAQAQEFLAAVQVNAAKENISQSDKQIFQTLQQEVQHLLQFSS